MVRGTIFSVKRAGPPHGPGVVVKQTGIVGAVAGRVFVAHRWRDVLRHRCVNHTPYGEGGVGARSDLLDFVGME